MEKIHVFQNEKLSESVISFYLKSHYNTERITKEKLRRKQDGYLVAE